MHKIKRRVKRPMVAAAAVYILFLMAVMLVFPSFGDRLFGYVKRENSVQQWIESESSEYEVTVEAEVISVRRRESGYRIMFRIISGQKGSGRFFTDLSAAVNSKENGDPDGFQFVCYTDESFKVGDIVKISGEASLPQSPENPGEWNEKQYAREQGYDFTIRPEKMEKESSSFRVFSFLGCTRDAVVDRIMQLWDQPYSGIMASMMCGEKGLLSDEEQELFQNGGISHLIAISGLHLTILAEILEALICRLIPGKKGGLTAAGLLWIYAFWTGGATATLRAALMFTIKKAAPVLGKEYDFYSCYAFTALILLLFSPIRIRSAGFWLSFLAVLGMETGSALSLRMRLIPYLIRKWIASSLGITLVTLPAALWFFYESTSAGLILNLWVIPTSSFLFGAGLLALVCSVLLPDGGAAGFTWFAEMLLKSYETGSRLAEKTGFLNFRGQPSVRCMIFYYAGLMLLLVFLSKPVSSEFLSSLSAEKICECFRNEFRQRIRGSKVTDWNKNERSFTALRYLTMIMLMFLMAFLPRNRNAVTFLSVGQGDCTVIEYHGITMVIDAGPSYDTVIEPFLKKEGIRTIDVLILSHPDSDHMEGALLLSEDDDFKISLLVLADSEEQNTEDRCALAENVSSQGGEVVCLAAGNSLKFSGQSLNCPGISEDGLSVSFIWPLREESGSLSVSGSERSVDMNDTSLTAIVNIEEHIFLFPGDLSSEGEQKILELGENIKADVLKTGHHGSRSSSSEAFLKAVSPSLAVISCGVNNRYGHPHEETLQRMENCGVPWKTTAEHGCIRVEIRKSGLIFREWIP